MFIKTSKIIVYNFKNKWKIDIKNNKNIKKSINDGIKNENPQIQNNF